MPPRGGLFEDSTPEIFLKKRKKLRIVFDIPGEPEKVPTFENSWDQEYFTVLNDPNFNQKSKDHSIFKIFLAITPAPEVQ